MSNFDLKDKKDGDIEKKHWKVRTVDSGLKREIKFAPIFEVNEAPEGTEYANGLTKEVECKRVEILVPDGKGNEITFQLNYADLYLFVYSCAEEELRRQLQMRWERQASNIPYEVTFKLSQDEKEQGVAKRLITLTVDELSLAIARAGAHKLLKRLGPESTESYVEKKMRQLKAKR